MALWEIGASAQGAQVSGSLQAFHRALTHEIRNRIGATLGAVLVGIVILVAGDWPVDLIVCDAFSSDVPPLHLITKDGTLRGPNLDLLREELPACCASHLGITNVALSRIRRRLGLTQRA
mgnify:CR=1 FL=1